MQMSQTTSLIAQQHSRPISLFASPEPPGKPHCPIDQSPSSKAPQAWKEALRQRLSALSARIATLSEYVTHINRARGLTGSTHRSRRGSKTPFDRDTPPLFA